MRAKQDVLGRLSDNLLEEAPPPLRAVVKRLLQLRQVAWRADGRADGRVTYVGCGGGFAGDECTARDQQVAQALLGGTLARSPLRAGTICFVSSPEVMLARAAACQMGGWGRSAGAGTSC